MFQIFFKELPNDDFLRIETCSKTGCHSLNWLVFNWDDCNVVPFTLFLTVTQWNLKSRFSLVMCLATAPPWCGFEKSGFIQQAKYWVFTLRLSTIWRFLFGNASLILKSLQDDKSERKNASYDKEAIIALRKFPTLKNIQCSSDLPCCKLLYWPALILY